MAGLQYLSDSNGRVYNYILTILPFEIGKQNYKNAFVYIREKNDYSPIEKIELAELNKYCVDRNIADYQIFSWKGINLSTFLCYEFTDIIARALLKGKCDIIALPVFNRDTTYFSNIIETSVRDLHSFIVQSNTSIYGDSRITCPYDKHNKDILKIKGGDNDNTIIGTINFLEFCEYQSTYYSNLDNKIITMRTKAKKNNKPQKPKKPNKLNKYDIKTLSARYTNHRTNRNN